jgi:hypothetical protein
MLVALIIPTTAKMVTGIAALKSRKGCSLKRAPASRTRNSFGRTTIATQRHWPTNLKRAERLNMSSITPSDTMSKRPISKSMKPRGGWSSKMAARPKAKNIAAPTSGIRPS